MAEGYVREYRRVLEAGAPPSDRPKA